jgi:hypothetical protein
MGNDSLHELYRPSVRELRLALDIVEHTLENLFLLPQKTAELKRRKDERKKKQD